MADKWCLTVYLKLNWDQMEKQDLYGLVMCLMPDILKFKLGSFRERVHSILLCVCHIARSIHFVLGVASMVSTVSRSIDTEPVRRP